MSQTCEARIIGHLHFQGENCDIKTLIQFLEKINDEPITHLRWNKDKGMWEYSLLSDCDCSK